MSGPQLNVEKNVYVTTEPGVASGFLMFFGLFFRGKHFKIYQAFCDLLRSRNSSVGRKHVFQ